MDHPKKERTLVLIKPDGVQRSLIGEVIRRVERTGLKIVGLKLVMPDRERAVEHYGKTEEWYEEKGATLIGGLKERGEEPVKSAVEYGKDIIETVIRYITSGPIVAMVVEGAHAVEVVKKLAGPTEPAKSDVGTIRGDLTIDSYLTANLDGRAVRNVVHCTDAPGEAKREIGIWFDTHELLNYRLVQEAILYDVNLDGILE